MFRQMLPGKALPSPITGEIKLMSTTMPRHNICRYRRARHHAPKILKIKSALGREPSLTELAFSREWSEHALISRPARPFEALPRAASLVCRGAGRTRIMDDRRRWACRLQDGRTTILLIEPFQERPPVWAGFFAGHLYHGARPFAVMDSLRFGPITPGPIKDAIATVHRTHSS